MVDITYKSGWVTGKEIDVEYPLTFKSNISEDKRKRYSTIPKQIKSYLRLNVRALKIVGEEWFVDL